MIWLLHRILDAFTRPALMRSFVDDFWIAAALLACLLVLAVLAFIGWCFLCWRIERAERRRQIEAERRKWRAFERQQAFRDGHAGTFNPVHKE